jgi:hypothetical protein
MHKLFRFAREFASDIRKERYDRTEGGILLKRSVMLKGVYEEGIVGQPDSWRRHENLIPDEGIIKILGLAFFTDSKINAWYLAPFSGSTAPAANLTAANFAATQTEITSNTEGYTEGTRQLWVSAQPAAGKVTNTASKAQFTIATASSLTITGSALLSASAKGATTGTLASCVKYAVARVLNNADVWGNGYEVSLSDS